jgi:hypothetical protein
MFLSPNLNRKRYPVADGNQKVLRMGKITIPFIPPPFNGKWNMPFCAGRDARTTLLDTRPSYTSPHFFRSIHSTVSSDTNSATIQPLSHNSVTSVCGLAKPAGRA